MPHRKAALLTTCLKCSGPLSLDPWLYVTPLELAPFAPLLRRLGVRDGFSAEQYAAVLAAMAEESGNEKLNEKSLAQALSIVQVRRAIAHGTETQSSG